MHGVIWAATRLKQPAEACRCGKPSFPRKRLVNFFTSNLRGAALPQQC